MAKFTASFSIDVPHYFDFVMEADSAEDAQRKLEQAVTAGRFASVVCRPQHDLATNPRAFVCEEIPADDTRKAFDLAKLG